MVGGRGAGLYLYRTPDCLVTACEFRDNAAATNGGGVYGRECDVTVQDCVAEGNTAARGGGYSFTDCTGVVERLVAAGNHVEIEGGGFYLYGASPTVRNCTAVANIVDDPNGAGGIQYRMGPGGTIEKTIVAFNQGDAAVRCADATSPSISCSDIFGNQGGDWLDCIADQAGTNDNLSVDPLFCDPDNGDFTLSAQSPCLPGNHPDGADCGLIGALGEGCVPTSVELETWAGIKARYRNLAR